MEESWWDKTYYIIYGGAPDCYKRRWKIGATIFSIMYPIIWLSLFTFGVWIVVNKASLFNP